MTAQISKARIMAYDALWTIFDRKAYAHVALHEVLERSQPTPSDAALASEIVHGVLTWERLLDHYIASHSRSGIESIDSTILVILRMSFYQLRFFTRVPAYAIVSDAVELTNRVGRHAKGFVNGVLRAATRAAEWTKPLLRDECETAHLRDLGLRLSFPDWLVEYFVDQYGLHTACQIMCGLNEKVPRTVRVNSSQYTRDEVLHALADEGVTALLSPISPYGIRLPAKVNPTSLYAYTAGMYSLQGESSMLVAPLFGDLRDKRILDACAAPGGKALHIAELAKNQAEIIAVDLHVHRAKMITAQAKRLGLTSIRAMALDARKIEGQFDAILLDAPCSGLGTIARKPDIKWRMTMKDIVKLVVLQAELLDVMADRVQTGGLLIYTTCTLSERENESQIRAFLQRHANFQLEPLHFSSTIDAAVQMPCHNARLEEGMFYLHPEDFGSDGFFFAKLRRWR